MNHSIREVLKSKLSTACPKIPIGIKIAFNITVNWAKECIETNVKLSLINKKGVMNILLHNTSSLFVSCWFLNKSLDLIKILKHCDTLASVSIFTWLNYPNISFGAGCSNLLHFFWGFTVGNLSLCQLLLFDILLFFHVELFESLELSVFETFLDMKSHWHCIKHIPAHCFIV